MKDYKTLNNPIPAFTMLDIEALPDSMNEHKKTMIDQLKTYKKVLNADEEVNELYLKIENAIRTNNGAKAKNILEELKKGEYEDFELIEPIIIE